MAYLFNIKLVAAFLMVLCSAAIGQSVSRTGANWGSASAQTFQGPVTVNATGSNQNLIVNKTDLAPSGIDASILLQNVCLGNNTTFIGCSGGYFQSSDDASVTAGTKGVLYGLQLSIRPLVARSNSPADDADSLVIKNESPNGSKATEAIYIGHNSAFGTSAEWVAAGLGTDANGDTAFYGTGHYNWGIDFCRTGACSSISQGPIVSPLITPASSSATCKQGVMAWDANFVYVCTAPNTWKRAALSAF